MVKGDKIKYLIDCGYEGPHPGDVATVINTGPEGRLFMVEFSDGSVHVESEQDRNTDWEKVA
jgi:hypothetical protein